MNDRKHIKHGSASVLALFAVGATIALPGAAYAQRTIVPATVCEHWPGSGNAPASAIKYSQFGRLENGSDTQALTVVCPIVRQNPSNHLNWVKVYARDRMYEGGTIGRLVCTLRSNNAWGHNFEDQQTIGTNASGGRYNLAMTFNSVDSAVTDGTYVLQCTLPPYAASDDDLSEGGARGKSSIGSIVIDEPN